MANVKAYLARCYKSERLQTVLERYSLSDPRNQQIAAIVMAVLMGATIISIISYSWAKVAFAPETDRDYRYIPFDMYDATQVCNTEMQARMGDNLLRSYVDQHSTRLDNAKGIYRVYIKADVGTLTEFHEVSVYCFVDKWNYQLDHYKEVDSTKKQFSTSDLKFFK